MQVSKLGKLVNYIIGISSSFILFMSVNTFFLKQLYTFVILIAYISKYLVLHDDTMLTFNMYLLINFELQGLYPKNHNSPHTNED